MTRDAPGGANPEARYTADILSIESGRLLGGGKVHLAPDSDPEEPEWQLNTVFGLDREDVILTFSTGLSREVTLVALPSGSTYEYRIRWNGEGRLVPSSIAPDA